jgi:lipopolysaccharide/colanic/teichoic acid biosynthesis glycosyltransferase
MQRTFDILFSSVALLLLLPLFFCLIIILSISGEGEVFFCQERIGKNNKKIKLYKFATMLRNSEHIGTGTVTLHDDPRILPVGKFLRKTKINELPQLINILNGDMSIIGPRPQTQRCFDAFPTILQEEIVKVRPGLSGIGSIIFRNEEELMHVDYTPDKFYDEVIMPYKGLLEAWYVNKQSLIVYFSMILLTIWVVLFPKSDLVWRLFKDLPSAPDILKRDLNFPV